MNVPLVVGTLAAAGWAYHQIPHHPGSLARTSVSRSVNKENPCEAQLRDLNVLQTNCPRLHKIWVDTAENTIDRDDRCCLSNPTIDRVWSSVMVTYQQEAASSPGVQLVAHAVV